MIVVLLYYVLALIKFTTTEITEIVTHKALIAVVVFYLAVVCLFAQNKNDRYHQYGGKIRPQLMVFGGPLAAVSVIEQQFSADIGANAGIVIRKNFSLSFYVQKLISKPQRTDLATIGYPTFTNGEIRMKQAGGTISYMLKPGNSLHWGFSSSGGLGLIELYANNPATLSTDFLYDDRVIVIVPKVFAELNLTDWLKFNLGCGYRYVGKINGTYTNAAEEVIPTFYQSDYSKPEFSFSLIFGYFGSQNSLLGKN